MTPGAPVPQDQRSASARSRLVHAAFDLFAQQGFEATTVDQIAARAEVGRTTFFRNFPTKEAVIFPDHVRIQAALDARLAVASGPTGQVALLEGAMIVLDHYLAEGSIARARYALTSTIPILRDAEMANQRRYEQIFRSHAQSWGHDELDAELIASSVVTAHNHVLRRWLRGQSDDPRNDLRVAMGRALQTREGHGSQVIVVTTELGTHEAVELIRGALHVE